MWEAQHERGGWGRKEVYYTKKEAIIKMTMQGYGRKRNLAAMLY